MTTTSLLPIVIQATTCAWCNESPSVVTAVLKKWKPKGGTVVEIDAALAVLDVCPDCEAILDRLHKEDARALHRRAVERAAERSGQRLALQEMRMPTACTSPDLSCSTCGGYGHGCQACAGTGCPMRCVCCRTHTWRKARGFRDERATTTKPRERHAKYPHVMTLERRVTCSGCSVFIPSGDQIIVEDASPGEHWFCRTCKPNMAEGDEA